MINHQRCEIYQQLFHNDIITLTLPPRRNESRFNLTTEHSFVLQNIDFLPYEVIDLTNDTEQETLIEITTVSLHALEVPAYAMIHDFNLSQDNFNYQETSDEITPTNLRDEYILRYSNFMRANRDD